MIVTKTAFADMAGIDKSTVTVSITRGKLVATPDGFIDTDAPPNAIYLATRRQKGKAPPVVGVRKPRKKKAAHAPILGADELRRTSKPRQPAPARISTESGLDDLDGMDGHLDDLDDLGGDGKIYDQSDKTQADVEYKKAQTALGVFKLQLNKKQVFRRTNTERMVAKIKTELKSRIQDMPRRLTSKFTAMARSGVEDKEIQSAWEREVDDALAAISEAMKHTDD